MEVVRILQRQHERSKHVTGTQASALDSRVLQKFRARLWNTGVDMPRSILMGRKVRYQSVPREYDCLNSSAYVVPYIELEALLTGPPLNLADEEAHEVVHKLGSHCFVTAERIDVLAFERIFTQSGEFIQEQEIDPQWVAHIHGRLQSYFSDCLRAFEYLDRLNEGAIDVTCFVESILRVMTNSVPMPTNLTGVQLLQKEVGTIQANRAHYVPDTFAGVTPLDAAEINDCGITCRKLFGMLAGKCYSGVQMLGYSDFERFWRYSVAALDMLPEPKPDIEPLHTTDIAINRQTPDFWSQQVGEAISALSNADHWELLEADNNRGRHAYVALNRQVLRYLSVIFAPHMITSKGQAQGGALVSLGCAELAGFDLDSPLAKQLDCQAQRARAACVAAVVE